MQSSNIVTYYNNRAKEYDKVFLKPERQDNLKEATRVLQDVFKSKQVLEIACGTGYWTERIAKTASSIFATDINESVLQIARERNDSNSHVTFGLEDIFNFASGRQHESLFGGFIWSHILLDELDRFLEIANGLVVPGGTVVFMDCTYTEGSNLPITETDAQCNTYQTRKLENGDTHIILKNFPTETFLKTKISSFAAEVRYIQLKYYWILIYKTWKG